MEPLEKDNRKAYLVIIYKYRKEYLIIFYMRITYIIYKPVLNAAIVASHMLLSASQKASRAGITTGLRVITGAKTVANVDEQHHNVVEVYLG